MRSSSVRRKATWGSRTVLLSLLLLTLAGNTADDNLSWGNSAEDVHFGDDTSELEAFDSSIWDSLFELATDDPFGDGVRPRTEPTVETVTPAEPVEATGPAPTTTITLLEGGLL